MTTVATSPFHLSMLRKANTWYSVCDGNWSDPSIWVSNQGKRYSVPQTGDDIYINHTVNYNNNNLLANGLTGTSYLFPYIFRNVFIAGTLTATSFVAFNQLIVNGNLQCTGTIDFSTTVSSIQLTLIGVNNFVGNFLCGTQSTVVYNATMDQPVMPATYNSVTFNNLNQNYLAGDISITGTMNLNNGCKLELGAFNFTSTGTINSYGVLTKSSGTGVVNIAVFNFNNYYGKIIFSSNPTVNISGNMSGDGRNGFNLGSGTVNVLTNQSWQIYSAGNVPISIGNNTVLIASGKTLTIIPIAGTNTGGWINTGTVNGFDGTSKLNITGTYSYGNTNIAMATGVFNWNYNGTSNISVESGVSISLPTAMNAFYDVTVAGTLTAVVNTTISHNFYGAQGTLQMAAYNFTFTGLCTYTNLLKSGAGTVNFNGGLLAPPGYYNILDFSAGNPTVNIAGNFSGDTRQGVNFGSGPVTITGNSTWAIQSGAYNPQPITGNLIIASGVTLTIGVYAGQSFPTSITSPTIGGVVITGTITGADGTSILNNNGYIEYSNTAGIMATGLLQCNNAANIFAYVLSGNQDILAGTYRYLTLSTGYGTTCTKKLLGNVSVINTYILGSGVTLNSNGYALTNP